MDDSSFDEFLDKQAAASSSPPSRQASAARHHVDPQGSSGTNTADDAATATTIHPLQQWSSSDEPKAKERQPLQPAAAVAPSFGTPAPREALPPSAPPPGVSGAPSQQQRKPPAAAAAADAPAGSQVVRRSTEASSTQAAAASSGSIPHSLVGTPYATFKVQSAVTGNEMLKPLTYFPLVVTVMPPSADDEAVLHFQPLPVAPHHHHVSGASAGRNRNRWDGDANTIVQRRYSELVDLRQLLVLQFPMLVIPPLPPKSTADSFNTYMQSQAHLCQQQRNIARFLREVSRVPEVMLYDDLVPNFFLYPRERLYEWTSRIRDVAAQLRAANASLEEHRVRHRPPQAVLDAKGGGSGGSGSSTLDSVEDAVSTVATEGTKLVRGLMGAVSSWVMAPASGSSKAASKDRLDLAAKVEELYRDEPHVRFWTTLEGRLAEERVALSAAAADLMKFIAADDETVQAISDVSQATLEFTSVLATAEPFQRTQAASLNQAHLLQDIYKLHHRDGDERFTKVYEALLFEVSYLEAVEDAVQFVRCLWRRRIETDLDRFLKPVERKEWREYVDTVDTRLKSEVDKNIQRHALRMRIALKRLAEISISSYAAEENASRHHPFMVLCKSEAYSVFE